MDLTDYEIRFMQQTRFGRQIWLYEFTAPDGMVSEPTTLMGDRCTFTSRSEAEMDALRTIERDATPPVEEVISGTQLQERLGVSA